MYYRTIKLAINFSVGSLFVPKIPNYFIRSVINWVVVIDKAKYLNQTLIKNTFYDSNMCAVISST